MNVLRNEKVQNSTIRGTHFVQTFSRTTGKSLLQNVNFFAPYRTSHTCNTTTIPPILLPSKLDGNPSLILKESEVLQLLQSVSNIAI